MGIESVFVSATLAEREKVPNFGARPGHGEKTEKSVHRRVRRVLLLCTRAEDGDHPRILRIRGSHPVNEILEKPGPSHA